LIIDNDLHNVGPSLNDVGVNLVSQPTVPVQFADKIDAPLWAAVIEELDQANSGQSAAPVLSIDTKGRPINNFPL
jgi:hypothetical protein